MAVSIVDGVQELSVADTGVLLFFTLKSEVDNSRDPPSGIIVGPL